MARWICERADEVGSAATFEVLHDASPGGDQGFSRMLAHQLNIAGMERAEVLERVDEWLQSHGVDDAYERDALTELIEPATDEDVADGQRKIEFARPATRYAVILRTLERLAGDRPMAILLDDIHLSLDALGFARHCLESSATSDKPLFLLATARADELAERPEEASEFEALVDQPRARRLDLEPLDHNARRKLIDELALLEPSLARAIADRTGGNPLFAVQLLGDWIDRDVLVPSPDGFALRDEATVELPEDLYAVWNSRLQQALSEASEDDFRALEMGAVLGRTVMTDEWNACHDRAGLDISTEAIERLFEHSLIEETDDGGRFVHGLLRQSLVARARRGGRLEGYHSLIADALQERGADDPQLQERIGRHLYAAKRYEEALDPLLRAVGLRIRSGESSAAMHLLDLRDEALDQLDYADDAPERTAGRIYRVVHCHRRGETTRARALADKCVEDSLDHGDASLIVRAHLFKQQCESGYEAGWETLETAREWIAEAEADLQYWWRNERGLILTYRGDLEAARREFETILESIEDTEYPDRRASALLDYARCELLAEDEERAQSLAERALEIHLERGDPVRAAETFLTLGDIARKRDDIENARESYRRSVRLCEEIWPSRAMLGHMNLGLIDIDFGRFKAARARLEICEEVCSQSGASVSLTWARALLLPCLAEAEQREEFERRLEFVEARFRDDAHYEPDVANCLELAGEMALSAERTSIARRTLELALSQWEGLTRPERTRAVRQKLDSLGP
ncbi:MAG: hypothetical protein ACOCV2_14155 [Persicimonas sp.]